MRSELAEWLRDEVKARGGGVREIERLTGVAKATLSRLMNGRLKGRPELETLVKLSEGLNRPLADLVEWSGSDLGLPDEDDDLVARLRAEASADPVVAEILLRLRDAPPEDRRAVLRYLRGGLDTGPRVEQDDEAT
jgi:transcriptional regulator with XRE-family HTH domain